MIISDVCSRGALVANDTDTIRHWLHPWTIDELVRKVQNPASASTTVQVQTGIYADEQDLLDVQKKVHAAIRRATVQQSGRAS